MDRVVTDGDTTVTKKQPLTENGDEDTTDARKTGVAERGPNRYYGTVTLDAARVGRDAGP